MASNVRRPSNLTAAAVRFRLAPLLPFSGSSGSVNSDTTRCSELIRVPSLVEGCDYKHWLVLMKPPNGYPPRNDIVQGFIRTLAMALGSIFPFLNSATSVTTLFLRCNYMDGPLPAKELKDLTILEVLDLSENRFSGSIPVTRLSSAGYKSLRRLRNLEIMDLSENAFTNSIFPFLCAATSLKSLFLGNNRMVGSFPVDELKYLTNLELLDLRINRFNGSTPVQEVSALRKLNALDLSDNEFSSSTELQGKTKHILSNSTEIGICKMKNMQELDLSRNKLVGPFPLCLTSLSELRVLDLSSNQMTGNVPSALGNLQSLKYLSLVDNNFDNLSKLRVLILGSKSKSFQVESKSFWKPKFRLSHIALPSCNLEKVPHFLQYQKDLINNFNHFFRRTLDGYFLI
ncbi:BnaC06g24270D [Brassica napus]|uniref:BnaC06g24270D protein n=1 Tax=Brassica napus TaxID=3708 RepID=A0A078IML0_BRANA|nr:BnaC06g24270D [Brassica napus]